MPSLQTRHLGILDGDRIRFLAIGGGVGGEIISLPVSNGAYHDRLEIRGQEVRQLRAYAMGDMRQMGMRVETTVYQPWFMSLGGNDVVVAYRDIRLDEVEVLAVLLGQAFVVPHNVNPSHSRRAAEEKERFATRILELARGAMRRPRRFDGYALDDLVSMLTSINADIRVNRESLAVSRRDRLIVMLPLGLRELSDEVDSLVTELYDRCLQADIDMQVRDIQPMGNQRPSSMRQLMANLTADQLDSMMSSMVAASPTLMFSNPDGMVPPEFTIAGTNTGRFSSGASKAAPKPTPEAEPAARVIRLRKKPILHPGAQTQTNTPDESEIQSDPSKVGA